MIYSYFVQGILIGFCLAIPVGPIGLLCIRRTLARGFSSGIFSGLGAATADGIYGAIAGFGVTFISNFLLKHTTSLRIIGGAFLCYVGAKIFRSVPTPKEENIDDKGIFKDYISTFALTLTNPFTLLAFAALFAAAGLGSTDGNLLFVAIFVAGVVLGSALWWLILTGGISFFHGKISPSGLSFINKLSGSGIAAFGILVLCSVAVSFLNN